MGKLLLILGLCCYTTFTLANDTREGRVVVTHIESKVLASNILGVDTRREVRVYLPPGYDETHQRFPVIYFLHSFIFDTPEKLMSQWSIPSLLNTIIQQQESRPFILVMADYSTESVGSFYQNNDESGRWLDFTSNEVVSHIDQHFRTLAKAESRGIAGHFMGARGALALGMLKPDVFSSVYALHPVATDSGMYPMSTRANWKKMLAANSWEDLGDDMFAVVFTAMSQAFLPNADNPPFFTDFMVDDIDGEIVLNHDRANTLYNGFLLDTWVPTYASNLKRLRGLKFDWGRYDSNADHIYANQAFTRLLNEYGIDHEAEEYDGDSYSKNWTTHGRVRTDMLPFFNRNLVFE